jgi:excisionase family DNA binding protein
MARALSSTNDTAEEIGVNVETIRRLHRAGIITGYRAGRVLRFDLDEVRAALRTTTTTSPARVEPDFEALSP